MLGALRSLRLRLWAARLWLRLRRHGVSLRLELGRNVRFETPPILELDPFGRGRGGSLQLRIGDSVRLGRDLVIEVRTGTDSAIAIGSGTVIHDWCRLQTRGGTLELGPFVNLRDFVHLKSESSLVLGERVTIGRNGILQAAAGVTLGDGTGLAERTSVVDSDHVLDGSGGVVLDQPVRAEPIVIGRGVFTGANAVVLRGSRIGDGALLAAGAVLNGAEVPPGHLAAGVPARVVRRLS